MGRRSSVSGVRLKDEHRIEFEIWIDELIIARSHQEFGPAHGHYEEFRFFKRSGNRSNSR